MGGQVASDQGFEALSEAPVAVAEPRRQLNNLHEIDVEVGQIGTTVRRGSKWADTPVDSVIDLCVTRREGVPPAVEGTARVIRVQKYVFESIPAKLIEEEHEAASRMYSGLLNSMRWAYGPEFSETEEVVCLSYERLS